MANPNPDQTGIIPYRFASGESARKAGAKGAAVTNAKLKRKKQLSEWARIFGDSEISESAKINLQTVYPNLEIEALEELTVNASIVANMTKIAATIDNKDAIQAARYLEELQAKDLREERRARYNLSATNFTADFIEVYRKALAALESYTEAEKADEKLRSGRIRELILKGGRGSIKSSWANGFAYEQMMNDPQAHIVFTRRYKVDLKDSVWSQWMRTVDRLGNLEEWTFTTSPMRAVYKPTGQIVYFLGADKPISKKSFEVPFGYIKLFIAEEADEMQGIEQLDKLEDTFLRKDTPSLSVKIFNPPASKSNFMNAYCDEKANEPTTLIGHSYYYNVPVEWLGQRFFDRAEWFKEHKPLYYANNYLGLAVGTGGELFNNVAERKIKKAEIANLQTYQGLDFGYDHPQVFVRLAYNPDKDTLYVLKEHYKQRCKLSTFLRGTAVKKGQKKPDEQIYTMYSEQETICDSANPDKIDDMIEYGWNAIGATKRWKGGGRAYGWEWLRNLSAIVIDPAITPLVAKELKTLEFEKLKSGEFSSAYPKVGEDGIAAMTYAMNRVIMASKELEDYQDYDYADDYIDDDE